MNKAMKTHKIRGISKSVCTAEQMIAYFIAFYNFYNAFASNGSPETALDIYLASADGAKIAKSRYNMEAVKAALFAGAEAYRARPFIARHYAQIGAAFPLPKEAET